MDTTTYILFAAVAFTSSMAGATLGAGIVRRALEDGTAREILISKRLPAYSDHLMALDALYMGLQVRNYAGLPNQPELVRETVQQIRETGRPILLLGPDVVTTMSRCAVTSAEVVQAAVEARDALKLEHDTVAFTTARATFITAARRAGTEHPAGVMRRALARMT